MLIYNNNLNDCARKLRKTMTDAEVHLWARIRLRRLNGFQFYRQRVVNNYIVDFYCPRAKLIIEVDGGQHYSDNMTKSDTRRDDYLRSKGLKVLRFSDTDVLTNIDAVLDTIIENIGNKEGKIPL